MTGSLIGRGVSRHSVGSVRRKVILAAVVIAAVVGAGVLATPAMADSANSTAVNGTDTTASVTASISAEQATTEGLSTPGAISVHRGDIFRLPIDIDSTGTAYVAIGSEASDFRSGVKVTDGNDDGRVVLRGNTYNLIDNSLTGSDLHKRYWTADSADSVVVVHHDGVNMSATPLPVDEDGVRSYDIHVGSSENGKRGWDWAVTGDTSRTVLRVVERRTNGLTAWSAPANTDLDSLADIRAARDNGTLTDPRTIENRTAVVAINASGLAGAIRAANGSTPAERFATLAETGVVRFGDDLWTTAINPAPDSAEIDLRSNATHVVTDRETDTVFVVMGPEAHALSGVGALEFTVPGESVLATDAGGRTVRASIATASEDRLDPDPDLEGPIAVENATVVRGDVATIPITVGDLDRAIVRLGSEYAGWKRVVRVADRDDDGRIDLRLNTYTAGDADPREAISAAGADRIVDVLNQSNVFDRALGAGPSGQYSYRVSAHEGYDVANGTGTGDHGAGWLRVDQRSTDGIAIHSAPKSLADELTSGAAIRSIDDGRVVTNQIVGQDLILVELEATGLQGAIRAANGSNTTAKFLNATDGYPVSFEITTPLNWNSGDWTVDLTPGSVRVVPDRKTGHYYVLIDATTFDGGLVYGDQYDPRLRIWADSPLSTGTERTVSTSFTYRDPATANESAIVTFDERSYAPIPNQTISGTTTLPPGTELKISVTSNIAPTTTTAFLTESTAVVAPDGSWSTTVDLSEGVDGLGFSVEILEPDHAVGSMEAVIGERSPEVTVTPDRSALEPEMTTLSGTSTFDAGTTVTVSLVPSLSDRNAIYTDLELREVETTIGADGDWAAEMNLSGLDPGWYQLRVSGNDTVATAEYRIGDVPEPEPIAVRNYRRSSDPTDELQPSEVMRAKSDYVVGDISLESAITVMRAYFFG